MKEEPDADGDQRYLLIRSETTDGKKFRPSDWTDRLQSTLSCLGEDEFSRCIDMVRIVNDNGAKCILVDEALDSQEPKLYRFIRRFADENRLVTEAKVSSKIPEKEKKTESEKETAAPSFRRALSF